MDSQKTIAKQIDDVFSKHKETVTTVSKTDENYFIKNPTLMYDWDTITKLNTEENLQSVDAIYLHVENDDVRLYFKFLYFVICGGIMFLLFLVLLFVVA